MNSFSFLIIYPFGLRYYTVSSEVIDAVVPAGLMWFWVLFHVLVLCGWMWEWFYESWEQVLCKESRTDVARISGDVTAM